MNFQELMDHRSCKFCGLNYSNGRKWHRDKWFPDSVGWYCHNCYYAICMTESRGRWGKWSQHRDRSGNWVQISKYKHKRV